MKSKALASLAALTTSSLVTSDLPTLMFSRIVMSNITGSWLTTPILSLSQPTLRSLMSTSSSMMKPDWLSGS